MHCMSEQVGFSLSINPNLGFTLPIYPIIQGKFWINRLS